jgi:GWxTD domain-containing protein
MKKFLVNILIIILLFAISLFSQKKDPDTLPPKYKKWFEEEVVYIITPKERKVFLQLKTDKDRDLFIKAFWKQRDPIPITEINEFKEEHYKRFEYANRNFVRGTPLPGWKTARGRIYIILGPPNNIQTYEGSSSLYPTLVWFYQGMSKYGLPDAFYIVFFKKRGVGDYELYSPTIDGPQSLLANYLVGQTNYPSAYRELLSIDPNLARISLSLIPGEYSSDTNPSLTSDRLLFDLNSTPQKTVKDEYAEKLLIYKDVVEVEYSTNYIENDSSVKVIRDKSGIFFVNYLLEIKKLFMTSYQSKYLTKLAINGKVTDLKGDTIFQYERSIPFEIDQDQFKEIESKMFCFQDMFPLVEGNYRFNLLLKNEVSKEFTSIERDIIIPEPSSLQMSPLILAYKMEKELSSDVKIPFKVENFRFFPSPRNDFTPRDTLFLFFQIFGLNEELKKNGSLEIAIYKGEEKFQSHHKQLKEYESLDFFLDEFSLQDFPPAYYKIRVSLFDKDQKEVLFEENHFFVSPLATLPRPWISYSALPPSKDPIYNYVLGEQLLNKKDIEKAKLLLEKAYRDNPMQIQFAISYCKVLFILSEYKTIIEILEPFLMNRNYEVLELLARSYHILGEFEKAISYYKDYISHFGINYAFLTLLGDCYYQQGNKEEALKAWEKSLELNPNQEKIRIFVESIKREKKEH